MGRKKAELTFFCSLFPELLATKWSSAETLVLQRRSRKGTCRAEFSQDAPFAIAIGACVLNSLAFPITSGPDDDGDATISSTDTMFAVMGVISFIPYFNWLVSCLNI